MALQIFQVKKNYNQDKNLAGVAATLGIQLLYTVQTMYRTIYIGIQQETWAEFITLNSQLEYTPSQGHNSTISLLFLIFLQNTRHILKVKHVD